MKWEYAIFDLDGTLLDYEGASHEAIDIVLSEHGCRFSKELHSAIIGTKDVDWSRKLVSVLGLENVLQPTHLVHRYHEEIARLIPSMKLMPGVEQLVRSLHAKQIPMVIATSSSSHVVPRKLSFHSCLTECISEVVTGDQVTAGKPAPDIFFLAAKRLGCADASKCLVFEDSPFGVLAGLSAGMGTIAIPDARFLTEAALAEHGKIFNQATKVISSLQGFDVCEFFAETESCLNS